MSTERLSATSRRRRRKPCACCFTIKEMLRPTMDAAPADAVVVMLKREAVEHIYTMAKKGAQ